MDPISALEFPITVMMVAREPEEVALKRQTDEESPREQLKSPLEIGMGVRDTDSDPVVPPPIARCEGVTNAVLSTGMTFALALLVGKVVEGSVDENGSTRGVAERLCVADLEGEAVLL